MNKNKKLYSLISLIPLTTIGIGLSIYYCSSFDTNNINFKNNQNLLLVNDDSATSDGDNSEANDNISININNYLDENDATLSQLEAKNFYYSLDENEIDSARGYFNKLVEIIKSNSAQIFKNVPSGYKISSIDLNRKNDTESSSLSTYGNDVNYFQEKNINGYLLLDVHFKSSSNNSEKDYLLRVCGFKRDHGFVFLNRSNKDDYANAIYESATMNKRIYLKDNFSNEDAINFLISNVFYYDNYNDVFNSTFTRISKRNIVYNEADDTYRIIVDNKSKIFSITGEQLDNITVRFYNEPKSNLDYIWIIGISVFGTLLLLLLIWLIIRSTRNKQKLIRI